MPERIGCTSTRSMDADDALVVYEIVNALPSDATLVTGACIGGDALITRAGILTGKQVHAIVPANRSQVDPDWASWCTSYELMAEGTSYRDRNLRIVEEADQRVIAIPEYPEDHPHSDRSGAWQTCRIARRAGKLAEITILRT